MSKDNGQIITFKKNELSYFDSLSDEQMKSINLFLDTENQRKEMLKEIKPMDILINVITTYEHEEQEIFDVMVNDIYPNQVCSMITEKNILGSIITSLKEGSYRNLDYLLKISLGYMEYYVDGELQSFKDSDSREEFLKSNNLLETIRRCNSKYYFQPNQRDIVSRIVADSFDVSKLTSEHDKQDYIDHMVNSPRYIEGKSLIEEHKPTFIEEVV